VAQLAVLDVILDMKATQGDPVAQVAHAAVADLILSDIASLQSRAKKGSPERRDYDDMMRVRRNARQRIRNSPEFAEKVQAMRKELTQRARGSD